MNLPFQSVFRLTPPGGAGLACNEAGIVLGNVRLVNMSASGGVTRAETLPLEKLAHVLRLAYGQQTPDAVAACYRGLRRAAAHLEAGDLALAGIEAVSIRLPALAPAALVRLEGLAELRKGGAAWQDEPRIPAGGPGGGQWTTGGGGSIGAGNGTASTPTGSSPRPTQSRQSSPPVDDGVYRPATDRPTRVLAGGVEEEGRQGIGGNEPPYDFTELSELFPGLRSNPGVAVPLAPLDSFLGISSVANQANLAASEGVYNRLYDEIRAIDPGYRHDMVVPLANMDWQGRANTINDLLLARAAVYYRFQGNIRPLQTETLRFLQAAVDKDYDQAVREYNAGQLKVPATRALAIGNRMDELVRNDLKDVLSLNRVSFGPGQSIIINSQDVSSEDQTYRRPDARLGDVAFDWTLAPKSFSSAQIRGFFRADSKPDVIVILRPSQLGGQSVYAIARPPGPIRKVLLDDPRTRSPQYSEILRRLIGEIDGHFASLAKIRRSHRRSSAVAKP